MVRILVKKSEANFTKENKKSIYFYFLYIYKKTLRLGFNISDLCNKIF